MRATVIAAPSTIREAIHLTERRVSAARIWVNSARARGDAATTLAELVDELNAELVRLQTLNALLLKASW